LIEVGQGYGGFPVSADSFFERGVVQLALRFQNCFQSLVLAFGWKEAKAVSQEQAEQADG